MDKKNLFTSGTVMHLFSVMSWQVTMGSEIGLSSHSIIGTGYEMVTISYTKNMGRAFAGAYREILEGWRYSKGAGK